MGKLEKVVVLSVLFLISIIIVLSLSTGTVEEGDPGRADLTVQTPFESRVASLPRDRSPETSTPLERPMERPTERPVERGAGRSTPASPVSDSLMVELPSRAAEGDARTATSGEGLGLLSSAVAPAEASAGPSTGMRPARLQLQADWDLVSVAGLERTNHPAFLVHRCARGETFDTLARALYGDAAKADLLRRNNEGLDRLQEGLEILVPVRDDRGPDAGEYVVQEGESLWVIAKRFYGKGSRWGEIFEANRDVLASPEAVRAGMKLQIP